MNHGLTMKPRKYSDILVGQFEIGKIIRVNRQSGKTVAVTKTVYHPVSNALIMISLMSE